jgi:nitrogen regulatory protein PII
MKLVILITAENEYSLEVGQAWQRAGAGGVTIIRSHGLYTLQRQLENGQLELPRMVVSMATAMAHVLDMTEEKGHLLMSVVDDALVDPLIEAASGVLGDLTQPDNGVLFVLPVERAVGIVSRTE